MAEDPSRRTQEIEALRLGIEFGMTLVDTAEMYGEGAAEELVAEAISGQRDRVFLVSKVYPHNASRSEAVEACVTNQVLYNVTRRGPEYDLIPWMAERRMPLMAYSPIEQGRLPRSGALKAIADKHGASVFQIALAWLLRQPGVIAIPKAGSPDHVRDNHRALEITLDSEDL